MKPRVTYNFKTLIWSNQKFYSDITHILIDKSQLTNKEVEDLKAENKRLKCANESYIRNKKRINLAFEEYEAEIKALKVKVIWF